MSDEQQPCRRSTDLPPDAPWWARWIDANIHEAWKWGSMWWPAFCAAIMETYAANPQQINDLIESSVPKSWWPHLLAGGFALSMILRVLNLTKVKRQEPTKKEPT